MVRRTFWIFPVLLVAVILARGGYAEKGTPTMQTTYEPRDHGAALNPRPTPVPKYSEDERALLAIHKEGRTRVQELTARIRAAGTREERLSLGREVEKVKQETRLRLLEEHMDQALAAGDPQRLEAARLQLERLTNPGRVERPVVHRDPPADAVN